MPANVETMFSAENVVPWHGLGIVIQDPVPAEEAIVLAGLDWEVEKQDMYTEQGEDIEDWKVTMRMSDRQQLGIVGTGYNVVQNKEAFGFMDELVTNRRLLQYHTAGSLGQGRRVWMLAKVFDLTCEPVPGDVVEPYLLLCNGHDGSLGLTIAWTSVRVVCQNTLTMALSDSKTQHKVRHTGDVMAKMAVAQEIMQLTAKITERVQEQGKTLARKQMGDKVLNQFFLDLVPDPEVGVDPTRAQNVRQQLRILHDTGPGSDIPGVTGTAWGALQAVTAYTSHSRSTRGAKGDPKLAQEKRMESSWFGSGNAMNQQALKLLEEV